jgi:hypothetical protein
MTEVKAALDVGPKSRTSARLSHRALAVASLLVGLALAILWSAQLADDDIGVAAANQLMGHNALKSSIGGSVGGILFAFVAGLAGTFTACNVAAFGAIGPLLDHAPSAASAVRRALHPLAWLAAGALLVAGVYGAIGGVLGTRMPQLSAAVLSGGLPVRILQSIIVFSVVGLAFVYLGLAAGGLVPDPLRRAEQRWPYVRQFVMGALIGAFLVGRPYPLFYKMFEFAAVRHNALYGALTFVLVVLGNLVLVTLIFLILVATGFARWLAAGPGRLHRLTTTVALVIAGVFTFAYWGLRVPAAFGYGWFPVVHW